MTSTEQPPAGTKPTGAETAPPAVPARAPSPPCRPPTGGAACSRCTPPCAGSPRTDPAAAHAHWISCRNDLFVVASGDAAAARGPRRLHRAAGRRRTTRTGGSSCRSVPPRSRRRMDVETGTDGVVPFELLGTVRIPLAGTLDVWRLTSYGGGLFVPVKDALAGTPGRHLRRRALPDRHDQGRRPRAGRRRTARPRSCSTSTSPTTRPARTTPPGRARSRRPATRSRSRSPSASATPAPDPRRPAP